jgi:ribulose kinase
MADLVNDRILIVRPGKYLLMGHIMWQQASNVVERMIGQITNSNTSTAITAHEMNAAIAGPGINSSCQPYALADLIATSTIKIQAYKSTANVAGVYGVGSGDTTMILAIEQPSW